MSASNNNPPLWNLDEVKALPPHQLLQLSSLLPKTLAQSYTSAFRGSVSDPLYSCTHCFGSPYGSGTNPPIDGNAKGMSFTALQTVKPLPCIRLGFEDGGGKIKWSCSRCLASSGRSTPGQVECRGNGWGEEYWQVFTGKMIDNYCSRQMQSGVWKRGGPTGGKKTWDEVQEIMSSLTTDLNHHQIPVPPPDDGQSSNGMAEDDDNRRRPKLRQRTPNSLQPTTTLALAAPLAQPNKEPKKRKTIASTLAGMAYENEWEYKLDKSRRKGKGKEVKMEEAEEGNNGLGAGSRDFGEDGMPRNRAGWSEQDKEPARIVGRIEPERVAGRMEIAKMAGHSGPQKGNFAFASSSNTNNGIRPEDTETARYVPRPHAQNNDTHAQMEGVLNQDNENGRIEHGNNTSDTEGSRQVLSGVPIKETDLDAVESDEGEFGGNKTMTGRDEDSPGDSASPLDLLNTLTTILNRSSSQNAISPLAPPPTLPADVKRYLQLKNRDGLPTRVDLEKDNEQERALWDFLNRCKDIETGWEQPMEDRRETENLGFDENRADDPPPQPPLEHSSTEQTTSQTIPLPIQSEVNHVSESAVEGSTRGYKRNAEAIMEDEAELNGEKRRREE